MRRLDGQKREYSLKKLNTGIIFGAMCLLLVLQTVLLNFFLQRNDQKRQDYVNSIVNAVNASLMSIGQNLESLGSYIGSYQAFQELYIERKGNADSYVEAYQTVRFMATYVPIVDDIVVVDMNQIAISYYSPKDYMVVDLVGSSYSFSDPENLEKKFFFWEDRDYFAYVVPISNVYSSPTLQGDKRATAIFVCDMGYIRNLLHTVSTEGEISLAFFDMDGRMIASHEQIQTLESKRTVYTQATSYPMELTIQASGSAAYGEDVYWLLRWFFLISASVILFCMVIILALNNRMIIKPIMRLSSTIEQHKQDVLKHRVPAIAISEINQIINSFNQMLDKNTAITKKIFMTQDMLYESELRKTEAEVYALQSQINPHFLYNTLQCIRSIATLEGSTDIADMTLALSELFRYAIEPGDTARFADELAIVKKYELITNIRFQYKFLFRYEIDDVLLECQIIKMLVQPLVENAVFHGVSKNEGFGCITVKGWIKNHIAYIRVEDNGPDIEDQVIRDINAVLQCDHYPDSINGKAKCLGLHNIHRRLLLRYGPEYGLHIERKNPVTRVEICFPINPMERNK